MGKDDLLVAMLALNLIGTFGLLLAEIRPVGHTTTSSSVHMSGTNEAPNMHESGTNRAWLTTADVANREGVTEDTVRRWIACGRIAASKPGTSWVIPDDYTLEP